MFLSRSLPPPVQVAKICQEYFDAGDIANVAESLDELGASTYTHYFVKRLVILALDRHDREREMASTLLSSLYTEVRVGADVWGAGRM